MINSPTIITSWYQAFTASIEDCGCDSRSLFEEAGLDIDDITVPYARYPEEKTKKLWALAKVATGNPTLGLAVADYMHPASIQMIGTAIVSSATLLEGLQRLSRIFHVVRDAIDPVIHIGDDSITIKFVSTPAAKILLAEEPTDVFFASCVARMSSGIIPKGCIKKFYYERTQPEDKLLAKYNEFFGARVDFGCAENAIEFDKSLAMQPSVLANHELASTSEQLALDYLQKVDQANIVLQTRNLIMNSMSDGEPNQKSIADALNLSPSQLQRRLQANNTTFTLLVQDSRRELAKRYLNDPCLGLVEISNLLGFSDQSNFTKAFKRWEGLTPLQYRRK